MDITDFSKVHYQVSGTHAFNKHTSKTYYVRATRPQVDKLSVTVCIKYGMGRSQQRASSTPEKQMQLRGLVKGRESVNQISGLNNQLAPTWINAKLRVGPFIPMGVYINKER